MYWSDLCLISCLCVCLFVAMCSVISVSPIVLLNSDPGMQQFTLAECSVQKLGLAEVM